MNSSVKTNTSLSLAAISQDIHNIFRTKSLETLQLTLDRKDISISEISNHDDFLYGQMMGYILINSRSMKASFKIHYSQSLAQKIAAKQLGLLLEEVNVEATNDFMREYCNLAAGYISDTFAYNNILTDISIPLITDGFDEVWFSDSSRPLDQKDYWKFTWDEFSLILSDVVQIRDLEAFQNLKLPQKDTRSSDEGITFL
ncbi:MAG: hypothetical protein AB8G05_10930 [Oligoflexales bacterium]